MKLDIGQTIMNVESHNKRVERGDVLFGAPVPCLEDAIKIMKMWRDLDRINGRLRIRSGFILNKTIKEEPLADLLKDIEEAYFPSTITAGYKIKVEGKTMEEIQDVTRLIEELEGVKEVRMHDKDC